MRGTGRAGRRASYTRPACMRTSNRNRCGEAASRFVAGGAGRILIFSAPVGAGHDAAAAALAQELRGGGADVEVVDGLALLGVERLVVGGYRLQILHAAWSWRLVYRFTRSRLLIRVAGGVLARLSSVRLVDRIAESSPDVIVSAYPIVSIALAGLRRRGRLPTPTATLVTDFDPHPGWIHRELDANLVVGVPGQACTPISPPTRRPMIHADVRQRVRAELRIDGSSPVVLIVGGAWGVGNLRGAARAATAVRGARAIVVTGYNTRLQEALLRDPMLRGAAILGFTKRMPELMTASDVLIQNAGGLTCLEAFAAGLPVVMFDPLPGHGEDNTRHMTGAGLVTTAASTEGLRRLLESGSFWSVQAPATTSKARALFDRKTAGAAVAELDGKAVRQPGRMRRLAPVAAVSLLLGVCLIGLNPVARFDEDRQQTYQVVPVGHHSPAAIAPRNPLASASSAGH